MVEERKEVLFILSSNIRIKEFEEIYDKILGKYPQLESDFNPKFLVDHKRYTKAIEERQKNNQKNSPALVLDSKAICIFDTYWKRQRENEKEMIVIHELGHIKYPLKIIDSSFLKRNGGEFLAEKYLSEIDKSLIKKNISTGIMIIYQILTRF